MSDFYEKHRPGHKKSIDDFIQSVTNLENAFASVLKSEVDFLNRNKDQFTPEQFLRFNENLEEIIRLAIKKEIILEFLLEEVKKCPPECKEESRYKRKKKKCSHDIFCHCYECDERNHYCDCDSQHFKWE